MSDARGFLSTTPLRPLALDAPYSRGVLPSWFQHPIAWRPLPRTVRIRRGGGGAWRMLGAAAAIAVLLVGHIPGGIAGQDTSDLSGQVVRVTHREATRGESFLVGEVVRWDELGVEVRRADAGAGEETVWIPRNELTSVAVGRPKSQVGPFVTLGAVAMGTVGAIVGRGIKQTREECRNELALIIFIPVVNRRCGMVTRSQAKSFGLGGALVGAVIGAVLGESRPSTSWNVVWGDPRAQRRRLQVTPIVGGRAGLSVNFFAH